MAERKHLPEALNQPPYQNGTSGPSLVPPPLEQEAGEVTLHEVVEILFKNKWIILACFVLVLSGVAIYTLQQEREYEATTTILVNSPQASSQLGLIEAAANVPRSMANEIEIIKSRRIAMRVAERVLDIEYIPGTSERFTVLGVSDELPTQLQVAQRLQSLMTVRPVSREVDIVRLTIESNIPTEAALLANLYAQEFVEYNRTSSRSQASASKDFLSEITSTFEQELQNAENDLTAFLNQQSVVNPEAEASQLITQTAALQQQQYQTQLEMGMVQAELRALEEQMEQVVPGLTRQLGSGDNLAIEALTQEITAIELAIEQMYARNPELRENPSLSRELVRLQREQAQYQQRANQRIEAMIEGVLESGDNVLLSGGENMEGRLSSLATLRQQIMEKNVQLRGLEARMGLYGDQLRMFEGRLSTIPEKDVILNRLERSLTTREQLYMQLIQKLQEARIAEQSELGYVDIVDEALVPRNPVSPNIQLNLILGAIIGLMVGLGLAFVRNAFDNKVRKPEDLRRRGYNVLGIVPDMERVIKQDFKGQERVEVEGKSYSTRLISLLNPLSPVAEGYRRLRTNIQFSQPDKEARVIMITSANPSEGKTVTALNLAVTMAQAGRRTLYIDADLRRPEGHRLMGTPRDPGLVDLLFDSVPESIEQFTTNVDSYLYMLPAGRDVPNPAEVLGSRKMQKFLAHWRQEFDVVVVDTPPILVVSDALIMASLCDTVVLVCAAGDTNWQAIERSTESLQGVGTEILGVMLNRFDLKAAYGGYKYGYGYGYGYEYSYYNNYYYGGKSG